MDKKSLFVFDFDGTLTSSMPLVKASIGATIRKFKDSSFKDEDVVKYFGPTEIGIIDMILGYRDDEAIKYFLNTYENNQRAFDLKLVNGMADILKFLKDDTAVSTILMTGRSKETLDISLKYFGISEYFDKFYTGSAKAAVKDELIEKVLMDCDINRDKAVYIGDTIYDISAMRKAGVDILSVSYAVSETDRKRLEEENEYTYSNTIDLFEQIKRLAI